MTKNNQSIEPKGHVPGGMYEQFATDISLETEGVEIDYGPMMITIARAGGSNKRYARVLEAKTKPHRRAIQTETMDMERAGVLHMETYAETIILKWETKVDGEFKVGIENPNGGTLLPVNVTNIVSTLKALPDLWLDLRTQATGAALFRETIMEDDAGN